MKLLPLRRSLLFVEALAFVLSTALCGAWIRSMLNYTDELDLPGQSRWRIISVGGRLALLSIMSRNLPRDESTEPTRLDYGVSRDDGRYARRVDSYLGSLGIREWGGFALCWDPVRDASDPLGVTIRVRLLMVPTGALAAALALVPLIRLVRRLRRHTRDRGMFEVVIRPKPEGR